MSKMLSYVHPFVQGTETLPEAFTFPFRYTPHPLCRRAALIVQDKLREMGVTEGKMFGVMIVRRPTPDPSRNGGERLRAEDTRGNASLPLRGKATGRRALLGNDLEGSDLCFLAAYSGQLNGRYDHPWFVPPVVDYLDSESYFQKEQAEIVELGRRMEAMRESQERKEWQARVAQLTAERDAAVAEAKRIYKEGKEARAKDREQMKNEEIRNKNEACRLRDEDVIISESQFQKANIQRAKALHREEIAELERRLAALNTSVHELYEERKRRSEALQQWLFEQFVFLNGRGEKKGLKQLFERPTPKPGLSPGPSPEREGRKGRGAAGAEETNGKESLPLRGDLEGSLIPSGAGECCAPKLLQAAYQLGLEPVAMAEFWWGTSNPYHYRQPGAFFPACHNKCRPILGFMLQGLNVEPDPAEHYEQVLGPIDIIWEDEYLAVVNKPNGWCSIPGRSDQANLYDEAHRLWPDIEGSVIVHRLDQDTSGVMVIAKNARIHRALSIQFEQREVKKRYVAILEKRPTPPCGHPSRDGGEAGAEKANGLASLPLRGDLEGSLGAIQLPIAPDLENMPRRRVDWENGKEAVTMYEVLGEESTGTFDKLSTGIRVAFYPQTGRTHQLRVHSASPEGLNAPIVGDRLYGHVADRLYLHAEAIDFTHPVTHERMHFEVPCPF